MNREFLERLQKKVEKALMKSVWDKDTTHSRTEDALRLWTLYATVAGALTGPSLNDGECCAGTPDEEKSEA